MALNQLRTYSLKLAKKMILCKFISFGFIDDFKTSDDRDLISQFL